MVSLKSFGKPMGPSGQMRGALLFQIAPKKLLIGLIPGYVVTALKLSSSLPGHPSASGILLLSPKGGFMGLEDYIFEF